MLKIGQKFILDGLKWRVVYVNASRAHCIALQTKTVTVHDRQGQSKQFERTTTRSLDISPDSQL